MGQIQDRLLKELANSGYKARLVVVEHMEEMKKEIEELHESGILDKELYKKELSDFRFDYSNEIPEAKSIIVIAMQQPMIKLSLSWKKKCNEIVIPPIYSSETDKQVLSIMEAVLKPEGHSFVRAVLPLKLLAVKSGLSMYGRNNISYVPEMGSFNKLIAFVTDMPCLQDHWQEAKRMAACDSCSACIGNCPLKCIDSERVLIHAEDCITYFNESTGELPTWLDSSWNNSLIGCMNCQTICPQNARCTKVVEVNDVFTEEEISLILNGTEINMLPEKTRNTIEKLKITHFYKENIISRNLNALINR